MVKTKKFLGSLVRLSIKRKRFFSCLLLKRFCCCRFDSRCSLFYSSVRWLVNTFTLFIIIYIVILRSIVNYIYQKFPPWFESSHLIFFQLTCHLFCYGGKPKKEKSVGVRFPQKTKKFYDILRNIVKKKKTKIRRWFDSRMV